MTKSVSSLFINDLEIHVHLGWPDKERYHEQSVKLNIKIFFHEPPKGCLTDSLEDTVCYSTLIEKLHQEIKEKKFRLIEHLTYEVHQILKNNFPLAGQIEVQVTKYPSIVGLNGGVSFCYADKI